MGIATPITFNGQAGAISFDFRNQQSYIAQTSFGQKEIAPGFFAMYTGDGDQVSDVISYDVNGNDKTLWSSGNGHFDQYRLGDFSLDADVNAFDEILWSRNNGISSRVRK